MAIDTGGIPERLELGPDNAAVRTLLAGLAHALTSGDGSDVGDTGPRAL